MIALIVSVSVGGILFWFLFRDSIDRLTRWVCGGIIILAVICFALYFYGILGIGLPSLILDLFGVLGFVS